ncbi:MAG: hypothetical protein H7125_11455 [Proteobacteria bacterium]|nr:hypothetical protein [Burkholderiales bacterium]
MAESGTLEFRSPYPGLRPFQDRESSIFFGRSSQVEEVILRLCATRFVALLGGSGSGKSSLVRAGVIPELRGYRIAEAGDFWVPILATPGTNMAKRDAPVGTGETPIDRLARKFVRLLRVSSDEERTRYQAEAVAALNKSGGFGTLINTFADRLDLPAGPSAERANFMLVIDQFEELFHWSNKDVPECTTLVERVLDHYYSPHPRIYLVITMRSEHLNDCAAFLRLPDAINKASYLVRRLDPSEIDETIEKPPRRYLRMLARAGAGQRKVPANFGFDEAVLARVQHDVEQIHSDPDHLALLQHLLARLWEAACARGRSEGLDVPDRATMADLERAVSATSEATAPPLPPQGNVLRLCLENWAQAIFDRFDGEKKKCFNSLLRRLAFKDPNTGMYTQQRLRREEAAALLGGADPRPLVAGFLPPCDYILWDDENPEQVTIKVFHEAFIRGWRHFQELIDREAELFEEFVTLLKGTQSWLQSDRSERRLVQGEPLARMRESALNEALRDRASCERLFQLLQLKHDSERYRVAPAELMSFMEASIAAEDARVQRAQAEELRTKELERRQLEAEAETAKIRAATLESNARRSRMVTIFAVGVGLAATVASVSMFNLKQTADRMQVQASQSATLAEEKAEEARKNAEKAMQNEVTAQAHAVRADYLAATANANANAANDAREKEKKTNLRLEGALRNARDAATAAVEARNQTSSFKLTYAGEKVGQDNLDLTLLLALEALSLSKTPEAMTLLGEAVQSTRVQLTPSTGAGHTGSVFGVALDSARHRLATAGEDNTVKVWDTSTGKEVATLRGHGARVLGVAFSEDGRYIASGSYDDTARLWDATTGTEVRKFAGHRDTINSVAFTQDGTRLATASDDRTAKLWEVGTGKEIQTFRGHNGRVRAVALSRESGRLATASDDGTAKLWDLDSGKELITLSGHSGVVTAVAFNPNGTKLATAGEDRMVRIWDTKTGKEAIWDRKPGTEAMRDPGASKEASTLKDAAILRGHTNAVRTVAFDASGTRIASGSVDNTARVWDADTGKELNTFTAHQGPINGVAFSGDGRHLVTGSADRTAKLWAIGGKAPMANFGSAAIATVTAAKFSPDVSRVATASGEWAVIWDAFKGVELRRFAHPQVATVAFSADGKVLASAGGNTVKVWSVDDAVKPRRELPPHISKINAIAFSRDGKRVAVAMDNHTVQISDVDGGREPLLLVGHEGAVLSVEFSADGRFVATGSWDDTARLWDAADGRQMRLLVGHRDSVTAVAFSADGARLATGSDDRTARIWDVQSGKDLVGMVGHSASVRGVAFVTIGKNSYLSTHSDDRTARLWDLKSGKEERALKGHNGNVQDVAVHPTQKVVLTAGADRTVRAHPQTDADLVNIARARVTRAFSTEECLRFQISGGECRGALEAAEARKYFDERKYGEAIELYNKVFTINPKRVDADTWNDLCWFSSRFGYAAAVVDGACERAVKLSDGRAMYVDSRGLARALTGRRADAIRDFEAFMNDPGSRFEREKAQRKEWIADLKAGRNPFTPEVLKGL